jgi:hypothetical protein
MARTLTHLSVCGFLALFALLQLSVPSAVAQDKADKAEQPKQAAKAAADAGADKQAELEAAFAKSLSGATLEGSYTLSGRGDGSKLRREKYTLGEVKKLSGDMWLFPARIEYGGKDVTLPIPLPVRWAGDTPVIVVDNVTLPGFGTVSARVLFFDKHYSGYWKHGDHSGNLFGEIYPAGEKPASEKPVDEKDAAAKDAASGGYPPAKKKP